MNNELWSWILAIVGLVGIYLAGRKKSVGWLVGMFAQILWFAYAIVTHQWGFIFTAIAYAVMYGKNWLDWIGEKSHPVDNEENDNAARPRRNQPPLRLPSRNKRDHPEA